MERLPDLFGNSSRSTGNGAQGVFGALTPGLVDRMSLRIRVLAAIALVLLLGAAAGGGLAALQTGRTLRTELSAALLGGRQTVQSAFEDLPNSDHPARDLRQLLATFNGNRHVMAALLDANGRIVRSSTPAATAAGTPRWFEALFKVDLKPLVIRAPVTAAGDAAVVLRPAPDDDLHDAWLQFERALIAFALASAVGLSLVYFTIGRALRPLDELSTAFVSVGSGDYAARVDELGPTELARVARGFNSMTERLAVVQARNRALEEQLLRLQDEERADLARDLHDEIGPHLFAVNVDASVIGQLNAAGRADDIPDQVRAIQASVTHIQRFVRDILGRLRPTGLVELGFKAAIDDLVVFWRARRPDITFQVDVPAEDEALPEPVRETIYRVVQESLSNAVRHGRPSRIAIRVAVDADGETRARISDDGAADTAAPGPPAFGLVGMRERVEALGGALTIERNVDGWSWSVDVRLPQQAASL
jgi:two-component system sensor histidine kinase UhpB